MKYIMIKYVGVSNLLPDSKNIQWKDKTLFASRVETILRSNCKCTENKQENLVSGIFVLYNYQDTDLVHEVVWGQVVVTARVSETWGGSCLVADHLVCVAAVAAACLQLLVHELCNR